MNLLKNFSSIIASAVFVLGVNFVGPVIAETADGETPAVEDVCAGQIGAAFGLCNAYCEAMDCDSADPLASPEACGRVQDKYQTLTGANLPCENACPCADFAMAPSEFGWVMNNDPYYAGNNCIFTDGYNQLMTAGSSYQAVWYNLCRSRRWVVDQFIFDEQDIVGQDQYDACLTLMSPHKQYLVNEGQIVCD